MTILAFNTRAITENKIDLRKKGIVPAVFYGKKEKSTHISVSLTEFTKAWKRAGESGVVTLKSEGKSIDVLIHDVSVHPVTGIAEHADFYVFEKGKKIEISIPLVFIGVSSAAKDLGGNLVKVLYEIKVSATPEHLPHDISVDIATLATFEDQITAKDIALPQGVDLIEQADEVVAFVAAPRGDEPEEPTVAPDLSAIEVVKKGKKEEEVIPEA